MTRTKPEASQVYRKDGLKKIRLRVGLTQRARTQSTSPEEIQPTFQTARPPKHLHETVLKPRMSRQGQRKQALEHGSFSAMPLWAPTRSADSGEFQRQDPPTSSIQVCAASAQASLIAMLKMMVMIMSMILARSTSTALNLEHSRKPSRVSGDQRRMHLIWESVAMILGLLLIATSVGLI